MAKQDCDVVVIGGGPAGSGTALFLARAGYDVVLIDREAAPRDKPCGEYLTPGAAQMLDEELGVLPALLAGGAAWLTRETIVPHNGKAFGGVVRALCCPRTVTDSVLRRAACAAGARIVEGVSAQKILRDGERITGVTTRDMGGDEQSWRARVTVGADGTRSLLARSLGVVRPIPRLQKIALVGHFHRGAGGAGTDWASDTVTMHMPSDGSDACCGVGAPCGPLGTRNINLVVPLSQAQRMAGRREAYFAERLAHSFPRVWDTWRQCVSVGPLRSVPCFGHHTSRASHDGAVLVGDAATFIHPFTGEGVFFALRGAMLAAQAIGAALAAGDVTYNRLRGYDEARRRELLPRYRLCDFVQRVVHSPALLAAAAGVLRRQPHLTDALLRTVGDLDSPRDLLWSPVLRLALST